ncbi:MAG: hypothetical protein HOH33_08335 [Verrucomicrobia bacterium]|jgi:hypothetical protein|nr:hypothetical protein [Verrucomicrobiota bacterium]
MQKIYSILALCLAVCWATPCGAAETHTFVMENGNIIEGNVATMDEESLVIRKKIGDFAPRTDLVFLSQDTLKWLKEDPKYAEFVDPFIELPEDEIHPPVINVRQPERMERPDGKTTFFSTLTTPIGFLLLFAFYGGNLFAAYEIAVFRGRPVALVCGLSAILPVIGPILFISLPGIENASQYDSEPISDDGGAVPEAPAPAAPVAPSGKPGLGLAKGAGPAAAAGGGLAGAVFSKDDTNFNRSFIETKFTEFFRVVPSASIRNLVLVFKTVKREYVATRITRISGSDLHLKLQQGSKEVSLSFGEIIRIEVRNK